MIESSFVDKFGVSYVVTKEDAWMPAIGGTFYSPDILSLKIPVAMMTWQGSDSDMNLLTMKLVYKHAQAAMNKYRLLKGFIYFISEEE
jgi:hypothetical protein